MPRVRRPRPARVALLGGGLAVLLLAPLTPAALAQEAGPAASPSVSPAVSPSASPGDQPQPDDPSTSPATDTSPSAAPESSSPEASPATSSSPAASPTSSPTGSPSAAPASAPVLRISTSTTLVRGNGQLVVSGRMYREPDAPASGVVLDVLGRTPGSSSWVLLGRMTTDETGLASLGFVPRVTREIALRARTSPVVLSETRTVAVQPVLTAGLTPRVTEVGRTGVVSGRLTPAYLGVQVKVQRRLSSGWVTVRTATPDSSGAYRAALGGDSLGRHVYRAYLAATPSYRVAGSALLERVVEGRSLRQGDRGPDVTSLQQRLAAQRVDVGRIDGVFGYDLRHAVTAFQKSQSLPRTGVYDKTTRTRLSSPQPVRLRHPARGRAVEVDITKQVLYVSEGGRLTRIVDVSTGNDELYESDGVTYRAFTPTGRYSVQRKIDGIRVSRLGELYRPAYFHQGWAIHGSPNVPVYPDSHGCVRVTNGSMDRLYGLLGIGVPVSLYRS